MVTLYMPLVKFIFVLQLKLSRPQRNHLISLMHGMILCEGRKTISQIRNQTGQYRDLSCITRFLKESTWCQSRSKTPYRVSHQADSAFASKEGR
jgi:hypothetical protein